MKKLGSFLLTIFVCLVIIVAIVISLDLTGVIKLPENLSLKKYLSKSIGTMGASEEIYFPDYEATGLSAENKVTVEQEKNQTTTAESQVPSTEQQTLNHDAINQVMDNMNNDNSNKIVEPDYNVTDNSYFYTQLDTYGKIFYSRLYSNLDNLKTGLYSVDFGSTFNDLLQTSNGETILTNAFQLSINALLLDHPEIFYLDVTKMYMFTESTTTFAGTTYKISIGPDGNNSYLTEGFNSYGDVMSAELNLRALQSEIINSTTGSTYDKILFVHNYLIDNISYDSSGADSEITHTLYGALINKVAVCDGYAKAFKFILDGLGISCVEVCGIAQNSSGITESHAWNDVLLDGKWYAVDVTWDDPIIIGGNGKLTNELRYSYFLKGSDNFYRTHQEDGYIVSNGEFEYPIISEVGYY